MHLYTFQNHFISKMNKRRMAFKLKDSAQRGDTYYLEIKDAVFATIDGDKDKTSLSTINKTLKSNDCSIVVQK